jgi:Undecaprenyl-phosphate glucose phosphotransferase
MAASRVDEHAQDGKNARAPLPLSILALIQAALEAIAVAATGVTIAYLMIDRIGYWSLDVYVRASLVGAALYVLIADLTGAYEPAAQFSLSEAWRRTLRSWLTAALLIATLGFVLKISEDFSRLWAGLWFVWGLALVATVRTLVTAFSRRLKRRGLFNQRAAIFGAGPQGAKLGRYITGHDGLIISITGYYDERSGERAPQEIDGIPVRGRLVDLVNDIRTGEIDQVIVALPWSAEGRLQEVVGQLALTPVRIRLAPDLANFAFSQRPVMMLGEVPVLSLFDRPISGFNHAVKWLEDKLLSLAILALIWPVLIIVAIAVKLDSPGPIFFRQPREGYNNRTFHVLKFRSMRTDAEQVDAIVQASRSDPRITRVGGFIRRTSLDELPQFFNVLKGDMSIVGPRPHAPSTRAGGRLFSDVVSSYASRHRVKPGITGWAQVHGWRGETNTEDQLVRRLEHDLYYIENWSLLLDLYIIIRTAFLTVLDRHAY